MQKKITSKTYVDVIVHVRYDGMIIPMYIIWEDERKLKIDKIVNKKPITDLSRGLVGMEYTCMINGKVGHLYSGDFNRWYVEMFY